ncbi:unnamed protein product [Aspergillus oryzae]|nr:unnamed protein product [Aspergillus oryzae]GMF85911.1 unnamed protein product [Aspergillus oryzae]GMG01149.1 unnamed protein product [Aspergillus oryzae]GMG22829.1 unnamed protein product [Aspergillus oryzae]GMG44871.1 unnamed protein product [Aspergillus oryzae var. brunneus]
MVSASGSGAYDRSTGSRSKREENSIRWVELLEKFKTVQERARRALRARERPFDDGVAGFQGQSLAAALSAADQARNKERATLPDTPRTGLGLGAGAEGRRSPADVGNQKGGSILGAAHRHKTSLPNLGRLGIGSRKSKR